MAADSTPKKTPVLILGAGLAGMSAALRLKDAGVAFRIVERQEHPGGHATTLEDSGYRFDKTGHLLHLRDPEMKERVLRWIGDDHNVVQRRSVIWSNGVYTRYPFQANTFGLPPAVAKECLLGFIEAYHRQNKPEASNFEEFCNIHFGEGISRHFMIPYNSRLWGVPPKTSPARGANDSCPYRSSRTSWLGRSVSTTESSATTRTSCTRSGASASLSESMAAELPEIELGHAPGRIDHEAKTAHFDDEVIEYDVLISTAPMPALVDLLDAPPDPVRQASGQLRCTHLYYLDVALDVPCGQPIHWIYVPEAKYPFYRVGCYSNFSEEMAPPGKACLYVELADRREPDLDALLPEVARGLVEMKIIGRETEIAFARLRKIDFAYVIFDHAYYAALETLTKFFRATDLVSVGRYGQWTYCSMEDALVYGRDGADTALRAAIMIQPAPKVSIVIPIYNEEAILHAAVVDLRERLAPQGWRYEIILAENGSRDRTVPIARELSEKYDEVSTFSTNEPNYGRALREGIERARGEFVLCDEIDLCDADFHRRAVERLESDQADMVIGSKLIAGAEDERPILRHAAEHGLHRALARPARLPRNRYSRPQGVPTMRAPSGRPGLPRGQGRLRQRVRDPRLPTWHQNRRDPREGHREASAVDQPLQACTERAQERRQAHLGDPRQGLSRLTSAPPASGGAAPRDAAANRDSRTPVVAPLRAAVDR